MRFLSILIIITVGLYTSGQPWVEDSDDCKRPQMQVCRRLLGELVKFYKETKCNAIKATREFFERDRLGQKIMEVREILMKRLDYYAEQYSKGTF
ncbi:hypothetical protein CSKR_200259 [Clonorchis sinensis]|uniref:Uncharacterized protein n=1 Tax=Clonorchis sinensis TaxID=79923 RepID=A0A8T1M0V8_CLOSI|nr:hypothetical protein CSKR_200259 [Clonorchis sinensis]